MKPNTSPDQLSEEQTIEQLPWLKRAAIAGGLLLLSSGSLGFWGWQLLCAKLPTLLEENLSEALDRPLRLGQFERVSPTGIRFGESILPPTAGDFTWAKAKAVDISFNPLTLIFQRTLRPNVVFIEPQVAIKQGFDQQWAVQAPNSSERQGLIKTELARLQTRNATLVIGPVARRSIVPAPEGVGSSALIVMENVNTRISFSGQGNQTASFTVGGRLMKGAFQLKGEGRLDVGDVNLSLQAQELPVAAINPLLGGSLFVKDGLFTCNLTAAIRPEAKQPVAVQGTARLRQGKILVSELPVAIANINGTLLLNGQTGTLQTSSLEYGPIFVKAAGTVDVDQGYALQVAIPVLSLDDLQTALAAPLPVSAAGRLRIMTEVAGPLDDPQISGRLENLSTLQVDRLAVDAIAAAFTANKTDFSLHQLTLQPATGGTLTAQGQIDFSQNLRRPDLRLEAQANLPLAPLTALYKLQLPAGLELGPLLATAQVSGPLEALQGQAQWALPQATYPGKGRLALSGNQLKATETQFQVGTGQLTARAQANLQTQQWQAQLAAISLPLPQLWPQLQGQLDSQVQASGSLRALRLRDLRAAGDLRLSEALPLRLNRPQPLLSGPLHARFIWQGDRLVVPAASSPQLQASGVAEVALPARGLPQITSFDFQTRLTDVNLQAAYALLPAPSWLALSGWLDFNGRLQGTLEQPQLTGTLGLSQLALNQLMLLPAVRGPMQLSRRWGAQLDLRGQEAALSADLGPDWRPNAFRWVNGELVAEGRRRGDRLDASLRHLTLAQLQLRPLDSPRLGVLGGQLSAQAQIDLADLSKPRGTAAVEIAAPALGDLAATSFRAQLRYAEGAVALSDGLLQLGEASEFGLTAEGRWLPQWRASAQITTDSADFQDILTALQLYQFSDLRTLLSPPSWGQAADLQTLPVGDPAAGWIAQADRARSARAAQTALADQRDRALIPPLAQLSGAVSGSLNLQVSQQQGWSGSFDISGQRWRWGSYASDNQFVARGQLQDAVLTLSPVEFRAQDLRLSLAGQVTPQGPALRLQAQNLPLNAIAEVAAAPLEMLGQLQLEADLGGSFENPTVVGQLAVTQPSINQQPLADISSTFAYRDATVSVAGQVQGYGAEQALTFSGHVPLALPFGGIQPASDQLALQARLKDDGLTLISLLSPAIAWDGGQALIDISVGGTLQQPLIYGIAAFDQAAFKLPALQMQLDQIRGNVRFSGERVEVEALQGKLMQGDFVLTGSLPFSSRQSQPQDGLLLALHQLQFNYADEIRSQVDGQISLGQAVLEPTVGGTIALQKTRVQVGPALTRLVNQALASAEVRAWQARLADAPVRFDRLSLQAEPTQISALPLLSLELAGEVALSGPLSQPAATGQLDLSRGWINTVTTEFLLESDRQNRVVFRPESGLDPDLDLVFSAVVPLQRRYSLPSADWSGSTAEIADLDPLASTTVFDEITVRAIAQGPASRLFEQLMLSSFPKQTEASLLNMAFGGYLADLGSSESGLVLASNLLTGFTAGLQDELAQALSLRSLRLSATTVLPAAQGDTLGYGVSLNLGITEGLAATLVQVLSQSQPAELNLRYRINNQWSIWGSTNLGNQHRAFLEYQVELP